MCRVVSVSYTHLIIITGGIDLSVGALMACASTYCALLISNGLHPAGALLVGVLIATVFGADVYKRQSEMELEKLNEKICDNTFENSMGNKGYALRNLNYQIQLQYGERSELTIRSTYGEGTTAVIRLENISEVEKGVV